MGHICYRKLARILKDKYSTPSQCPFNHQFSFLSLVNARSGEHTGLGDCEQEHWDGYCSHQTVNAGLLPYVQEESLRATAREP